MSSAANATNTARLDSGADVNILRRSTVEANNFPSTVGPPTAVVFGNGQSSIARDHATVGQLPAIVCDDRDLKEDLISVNPLLDALDTSLPWKPTSAF